MITVLIATDATVVTAVKAAHQVEHFARVGQAAADGALGRAGRIIMDVPAAFTWTAVQPDHRASVVTLVVTGIIDSEREYLASMAGARLVSLTTGEGDL
jgi:hypothetical protein